MLCVNRCWRRIGLLIAGMVLLGLVFAVAAVWWSLPSVEGLRDRLPPPPTRILDRNGRLLYERIDPRAATGGRRAWVPLDQLPPCVKQATIAVEDASFYTNPGVDWMGMVRALWINLRGGEVLAGGSTITQQLARMALLEPAERQQRTVWRKMRESLLAWQIAQRYTKDQVLEFYLNQAYYGNLAYGVGAASQVYFGKPAFALTLSECALLAGLLQSPSAYDPLTNWDAARERQAVVLGLMVKQGVISAAEAEAARSAPLLLSPQRHAIRAPHFVAYVLNRLAVELGEDALARGGLIVTTTLDLDLHESALSAMRAHLHRLNHPPNRAVGHDAHNAAVVVLDPRSGEVLTLIGSPDYFDASISGAVNAALSLRQPGSAIKPLTYVAAFQSVPGFTAATPIFDVRTAFPTREGIPYVPVNYDRRHHGPLSVRAALATSNNVAAVKVLQMVGVEPAIALMQRMGVRSLHDAERYGLSLTLGGGEVRLFDLTSAYSVLARRGERVEPVAILQVADAQGRVLLNRLPLQPRAVPVLDEKIAWLITDILSDNDARAAAFGEFSPLRLLDRPAAVKTGTTTDFRDNWTIGYTPQRVVGVWVGNADGRPMQRATGVTGAAPIWRDVMRAAHADLPVQWFEPPPGLVRVEICALSGLLPSPDCLLRRFEWFIDGTQPATIDTWHRRWNGRIAFDLPPELREWAREQGWLLWQEAASRAGGDVPLRIVRPDDGTVYRISPELPASAQRIPLDVQVVAAGFVSRVEVWKDGALLRQFDRPPYRDFWELQPGAHTFVARAHLRDGQMLESPPVRVWVK